MDVLKKAQLIISKKKQYRGGGRISPSTMTVYFSELPADVTEVVVAFNTELAVLKSSMIIKWIRKLGTAILKGGKISLRSSKRVTREMCGTRVEDS